MDKKLLPILSVNFVGTLGFSIVLPFLVFLVTRWGGNAWIYGLLGATYSMFQLIGAPILGRWSDRIGRRRVLLISQLGTLASWLVFLLAFAVPADTGWEIESRILGVFSLTLPLVIAFVARAVDGLTGGNVSVANAYLADITSEEQRTANFGKMAIAANLGFILGPAIAGLLGGTRYGELLPVLAALTISVVASGIVSFALPETNPCALSRDPDQSHLRRVFGQEQRPCIELADRDSISLAEVLRVPEIPGLLTQSFLVMLGFHFFYVAFPVFAVRGLSWTVKETGVFFSVMGLLMVVVQGPVLERASKRLSEVQLIPLGSLLLALGFAGFSMQGERSVWFALLLLALGNGLMWPSLTSRLSIVAGDRYQGTVQGFASSAGAVASVIGLVVGGLLFGALEQQVFLLSGVTISIVVVLSLLSLCRKD